MRLNIELSADEYFALKKKQGDRTYREILLGAVGVDADKRRIGRPAMDVATINLEAFHERVRKADAEAMKTQLKDDNESKKDERKKLDAVNKRYMAKLRGEG